MQQAHRFAVILMFAAIAAPVWAQNTVIQAENVRTEYARVLRADPVYQTLRATSVVENCGPATDVQNDEAKRGIARVVGVVKDALTPGNTGKDKVAAAGDCRMVPMDREFRRPIAYDVDYVYKGSKFRTRMARDPGNRLRVRVSITPQPTHDR